MFSTMVSSAVVPPFTVRRNVLQGLALGGVCALGWAGALAHAQTGRTPALLDADAQAWRALSRVGYGPTPELVREGLAKPWRGRRSGCPGDDSGAGIRLLCQRRE